MVRVRLARIPPAEIGDVPGLHGNSDWMPRLAAAWLGESALESAAAVLQPDQE
jgi:hypothetical protein